MPVPLRSRPPVVGAVLDLVGMQGRMEFVVIGAGRGGACTGIARSWQEQNHTFQAVVVQPVGSVCCGASMGDWEVEGVGNSFLPASLDLDLVDRVIDLADVDRLATVQECTRTLPAGGREVTLLPNGAARYMSKLSVADLEL